METPRTTYEIRDRHGKWHPLSVAQFYVASRGYVLTYFVPGREDVAIEQHQLEALIDKGTVRAAHVAEYLPADEARRLINTVGRESLLLIYFTKADGTTRRMVCYYKGSGSYTPAHMVVYDVEADDYRNVDTTRVFSVRATGPISAERAA